MNQTNRPLPTTSRPAPLQPPSFLTRASKAVPQARHSKTPSRSAQPQTPRRTVHFELDLPEARSVCVVGTFNDWRPGATPLISVGGGKWATDMSLAFGRYEYRFMADGNWIDDLKAKGLVANPYGGRNAALDVI